jgi:hypothetical protein
MQGFKNSHSLAGPLPAPILKSVDHLSAIRADLFSQFVIAAEVSDGAALVKESGKLLKTLKRLARMNGELGASCHRHCDKLCNRTSG